MKIYCDETGFTGSNLLDKDQSYFVYSSVAIDPARGEELVNRVVLDCKLQGPELKGGRLVKNERGRRAIRRLLSEYRDDCRLAFVDKPFTLACKFHEYIFEPLYAEGSGIFYESGFHKFIANVLHREWRDGGSLATDLLSEFQELMRSKNGQVAKQLFSGASNSIGASESLQQILLFTFLHKKAILDEIEALRDFDVGSWILEVTNTSLFSLLTFWAKRGEELEVYCDDSKPLLAQKDFLNHFIGRESSEFQMLSWQDPMSFPNLAGPIQLVDSSAHHGIQIADALGAGLCYALNAIREPEGEALYEEYGQAIQTGLFPEIEYVDWIEEEAFVNSLILLELVDRSARKETLISGMQEYIESRKLLYPEYRRKVEATKDR